MRGRFSQDTPGILRRLAGFLLEPVDAVGVQQTGQPGVFGTQARQLVVPVRRLPDHLRTVLARTE